MALAAVTQILLDRLGWQWAMRCLGLGAGSLSLLCSYFIKVRTAPAAQLAILSHFRKNKRNSISAASGGPPKPQPPPLDFAVFRNSKFIVLFFIGFTAMWVNNIPFQFGPLFATQAVGVSASTASLVLSIMNGCSSFGRIAWGFTSDRIGSQNVLFVASFFCFASILALWIPCGTGTVSLLFAFAVAYGFCAGALFSMLPTVLATTVGTEGFAGKIGMLVSFKQSAKLFFQHSMTSKLTPPPPLPI